jgi:hypothetical protein
VREGRPGAGSAGGEERKAPLKQGSDAEVMQHGVLRRRPTSRAALQTTSEQE